MRAWKITVVAAAMSVAASCSGTEETAESPSAADQAVQVGSAQPDADPAGVGANELGAVPVLMYHRITTEATTVYDRSPKEFRAELERLAAEGYVPVTAAEYVTGKINIPAGRHPVVLTFDDSSPSQFSLRGDGTPDPRSAVGILLEVSRRHPGFRPVATMFVNGDPFEEPGGKRTLNWLHRHGFEIGNHTATHQNLGQASAAQVRTEIAGNQKAITGAVPGISVRTLALPFGIAPDPPGLAAEGESGGTRYHHQGVFLVGAGPAPSPFTAAFDPQNIPRIRSQGRRGEGADLASARWLDRLAAEDPARYTSDGDPATVSFPESSSAQPAPRSTAMARPY